MIQPREFHVHPSPEVFQLQVTLQKINEDLQRPGCPKLCPLCNSTASKLGAESRHS